MKKIHYPNLNFVRSFAAIIVIIHHIEQLKFIHGYASFWTSSIIFLMGKLGVDLFFVLSGFLITSLLIAEKNIEKNISIKDFLMRRVLRIWPVYYLIMVVAFFITPHVSFLQLGTPFISSQPHFFSNLTLYLFFLPQIQLYYIGPILYCSQAWSIGIEEYFYLFWPFIVDKLKINNVIKFICLFIFVYISSCVLLKYLLLNNSFFKNNSFFIGFYDCLISALKFDCLLIGAIFGIYNNKLKDKAPFFTDKWFQIFLYFLEIVLVISGKTFNNYYWEIHAIIYGLLIFNLVRPETSIINMEYPIFNFIGKISYGMYMYHFLIANTLIIVLYHFHLGFLIYPVVFFVTILISSFSYQYFEKVFLKKKIRYAKIQTG